MSEDAFQVRLRDAEHLGNAVKRGHELEQLIGDVFRALHFDVKLNPGTARPRQTDVLASKPGEVYLVECKWRADKANIDDLDTLRSRLRRTDGAVVGILVSYNGFSGSVLFDVEHHRDQPILLISGNELRSVVSRIKALPDLLWRKREALLADGRVLLDEPPRRRQQPRRRVVSLPSSYLSITTPTGSDCRQIFECAGSFGRTLFAHELETLDWSHSSGFGVALDVRPEIRDEHGVLDLLDKLANLGWVTRDATWSIHQMTRTWHGMGAAEFAAELPAWRERAKTPDAHHSEEICYFDRCDGGFYSFTVVLSAHPIRQALAPSFSFQLQGIPLDNGPLLQLCRSAGIHDGVYFRPRTEPALISYRDRASLVGDVKPVRFLATPAEADEPFDWWAVGVVIENPFYRADGKLGEEFLPEMPALIRENEYLLCALRHYHPLDGRKLSYDLVRMEGTSTSDISIYRPLVDWTE